MDIFESQIIGGYVFISLNRGIQLLHRSPELSEGHGLNGINTGAFGHHHHVHFGHDLATEGTVHPTEFLSTSKRNEDGKHGLKVTYLCLGGITSK